MLRSLYSGITGLINHQTRMDVIGNNVANVNTTGFKKGRVQFQDLISQTLQGAARPREEVGGVNPKQVGLGMQVASIDTLHIQGSLQTTGVKTDLAVEGEGFFVLRDAGALHYTRAGNFSIDANGSLVDAGTGRRVQGWNAQVSNNQTIINTAAGVDSLVIPVGNKDNAVATASVSLSSNLDKNTPVIPAVGATPADNQSGTWVASYDIFDNFGDTHRLAINFTQVAGTPNQWNAQVQITSPDGTNPVPGVAIGGIASADGQTFIVDFNSDGTLLQLSNPEGGLANAGDLAATLTFQVPDSEAGGLAQITQTVEVGLGQVGSITNAVTQFAAPSTTRVYSQNGYALGYLEDFRIDSAGIITGVYSNGNNRTLGQLALASFTNPGGLDKIGNTSYLESINSGIADIGVSGTSSRGVLSAGTLELSNVDLAEEFTDMIVTQRGFQANSRTITTSDQLLQELLTLKR